MRVAVVAGLALAAVVVTVLLIRREREPDNVPLMLLTGKVDGSFDRGALTRDIRTSDVYCGWSKKSVVVHVQFRNSSAERATVHWRPAYALLGGPLRIAPIQITALAPGESENLFVSRTPRGVKAGSRITLCSASAA
jgi:hypothetical protein